MNWTIIFGVIGLAGAIGTYYYGMRSRALSKQRRSINWVEIQVGAVEIFRRSILSYHPDCLVLIAGPSALIGNIAITQLKHFLPVYLIMMEDRKRSFPFDVQDYHCIETAKWRFHIPDSLLRQTNRKLLIIDDSIITGDSARAIRSYLNSHGFENQNILYASLLCSKIADDNSKAQDSYWLKVDVADFYYPWGLWY